MFRSIRSLFSAAVMNAALSSMNDAMPANKLPPQQHQQIKGETLILNKTRLPLCTELQLLLETERRKRGGQADSSWFVEWDPPFSDMIKRQGAVGVSVPMRFLPIQAQEIIKQKNAAALSLKRENDLPTTNAAPVAAGPPLSSSVTLFSTENFTRLRPPTDLRGRAFLPETERLLQAIATERGFTSSVWVPLLEKPSVQLRPGEEGRGAEILPGFVLYNLSQFIAALGQNKVYENLKKLEEFSPAIQPKLDEVIQREGYRSQVWIPKAVLEDERVLMKRLRAGEEARGTEIDGKVYYNSEQTELVHDINGEMVRDRKMTRKLNLASMNNQFKSRHWFSHNSLPVGYVVKCGSAYLDLGGLKLLNLGQLCRKAPLPLPKASENANSIDNITGTNGKPQLAESSSNTPLGFVSSSLEKDDSAQESEPSLIDKKEIHHYEELEDASITYVSLA